jgi:DNA-binding HxlR family transcriptional regulator
MKKNEIMTNDGNVLTFDRGNVLSNKCPSRDILKHVTSRWAVLIFFVMRDGETYRFSELRRIIQGISEKMLAQTLQTLEKDGFISRTSYPVVPPKVEYNLTPSGIAVSDQVIGLASWIEDNIADILDAQAQSQENSASG